MIISELMIDVNPLCRALSLSTDEKRTRTHPQSTPLPFCLPP
jgi:hypothetical protein